MLVYLASPFFTPSQLAAVEKLEILVGDVGHEIYSPRRDGVLIDMTPAERKKSVKKIFESNVYWILRCDAMVALIDDRDAGVIWELGFAYATRRQRERVKTINWPEMRPRIVTCTEKDYGLNVMIQECVDSHCRSADQLRDVLRNENWTMHRDFDAEKVT
jgi:nucleoside 2-deoxyribosyltransferase